MEKSLGTVIEERRHSIMWKIGHLEAPTTVLYSLYSNDLGLHRLVTYRERIKIYSYYIYKYIH